MTTFVLIPGAGGSAWYWSRVVPLLERAGHRAIAIDLPGDQQDAGLSEYAQLVVDATGRSLPVTVVAQSLGGFTAAMAGADLSVESLTFVNAMIPVPGETPGEWWENTGALEARAAAAVMGGYGDFEVDTYFLHDVPPEVVAEGAPHQRPEVDAVFASPCVFRSWPSAPIRVLVGSDDRFFPAEFQRRVARERLGMDVDVMPGGHLIALRATRLGRRLSAAGEEVGMSSSQSDRDSPLSIALTRLDAVKDVLTVRRVFGDAYELDGVTVIPVAAVRGGGGGGGGEGDAPDAQSRGAGAGLGFGVTVRPVGAFVVKDGTVAWSPSIDTMRIVMGGQLVALAGIFVVGRVLTHHRRRRG